MIGVNRGSYSVHNQGRNLTHRVGIFEVSYEGYTVEVQLTMQDYRLATQQHDRIAQGYICAAVQRKLHDDHRSDYKAGPVGFAGLKIELIKESKPLYNVVLLTAMNAFGGRQNRKTKCACSTQKICRTHKWRSSDGISFLS